MEDWDQIIRRDGPAVWRTVCRLVANRADAEECFQEAFVSALEAARREPVLNPRALLLRMASARAMDRLRQRYRRRKHEAPPAAGGGGGDDFIDALPSGGTTPGQHAEAAELSGRLREALATLPPRQADAFVLCALEGWTYQEAAEQLKLSPQNVGVLVHRARGRLRELLSAALGTDGVGHAKR